MARCPNDLWILLVGDNKDKSHVYIEDDNQNCNLLTRLHFAAFEVFDVYFRESVLLVNYRLTKQPLPIKSNKSF